MSREFRVTRRSLLGGAAAGGAASIVGRSYLPDMLAAKAAPAVIQNGGSLTYWGGLIFSEAANNLLVDTINAWGEDNNIETEVVMINQNETNQKVSAAVESDTMPAALDLGLELELLLTNTEPLADLEDFYTAIGEAHGGWYPSLESASMLAGAHRRAIRSIGKYPFLPPRCARSGRPDSSSGYLAGIARVVGAGSGAAALRHGFGALECRRRQLRDVDPAVVWRRIADDAGTTVTIASEETRAFMDWVTGAYEEGLFPPGATTWDGAGDNTAYLSGQAVFIVNTGSVHLAAQEDDPELDANTAFSAVPSGPVSRVSPVVVNLRAIPNSSRDLDAAKALIKYLANPEFMEAYYNVAIYGPALQGYESFPIFTEPVHAGLLEVVKNGTAPGPPTSTTPRMPISGPTSSFPR